MKLFVWGKDGWYECHPNNDAFWNLYNLRVMAKTMGLCTAWVKREDVSKIAPPGYQERQAILGHINALTLAAKYMPTWLAERGR